MYSSVTGQVYESSDERAIAEGMARAAENEDNGIDIPLMNRDIGPESNGATLTGIEIDGIGVGAIRNGTNVNGAGVSFVTDY